MKPLPAWAKSILVAFESGAVLAISAAGVGVANLTTAHGWKVAGTLALAGGFMGVVNYFRQSPIQRPAPPLNSVLNTK